MKEWPKFSAGSFCHNLGPEMQKAQKLLRKLPGGISLSQSGNSDAAALAAGLAALGAWALIQVRHHGDFCVAVRGNVRHNPTCGAVLGRASPLLLPLPGRLTLDRSPPAQCSQAGCLQGLSEPPYVAQRDVPGLQLAIAAAIAVYLLREKKRVSLGAPPAL